MKNNNDQRDKGISGRFFTMERFETGYRMVTIDIVNGRVVSTTYSDYNIRPIIETNILKQMANYIVQTEQ